MLAFKKQIPSLEEMREFFYQTDSVFDIPLSQRVNIDDYTLKLFNYSSFYVCYDEEEIVGMICCYINQPPIAFISHVCVRPEYQHQGIFAELFEMLVYDCIRSGMNQIRLEVYVGNIKARRAYEKQGFEVIETTTSSSFMMTKTLCL